MVFKSPFPPVPISNESFPEKLLQAIWKHGELYPNKPALIAAHDNTKCLTFHQVHSQVLSLVSFLRKEGFNQGDVVCVVLPNCIEWPIIQLGVMAAGGAISGASTLFTEYELERQFSDSQCSIVFTDDTALEKVINAVGKCERVKKIICVRNCSSKPHILPSNVVEWIEVITSPRQHNIVQVNSESVAFLPYSSGTTGSPKGVMLSHRNIGTSIDTFIDHYNREIYSVIGPKNHSWYNETYILNLPFYHILGFLLLNISLLSGGTAVVTGKFEPRLFLETIEKYRLVTCGAAPMGRDLCLEFLERHRNVKYLCQGYGMTECGFSHLSTLNVKESFAGIGKAVANSEQKIIDTNGNEVRVGESGELCIRSPTVMLGYLNRPESTRETIDSAGWLHTGDVGYMEADGRTFIVDRLKELIKVKGLQVAPAELEDLLLSHPLIRDAAVIGFPDSRIGELVRAFVVRANESLNEEGVIKFVAEKVSAYKQITGGVKFVEQIPKSPSGKILRRLLRDQVAEEMKAKL